MNITDFLSSHDVIASLRAPDKDGALEELARLAAAELKIPAETISAEVLKREQLGSTGMGNGIALPHARLAEVTSPFGILARLKQPVDFQSVDGEPVDLVFLLLLPSSAKGEQLNALACVARRLRDPGTLKALRDAKDGQVLYREIIREPKQV